MKACNAKKCILVLGCFALLTSIAGYSGLWRIIFSDPYREIKIEACRIIDAAKTWYVRPAEYGGGERSFNGLNYHDLGLPSAVSGSNYIYREAEFRLENIRKYTFDLVITAPDGVMLECRGLTFDTRPVFRRVLEKDAEQPGRKSEKAV